MTEEQKSTISFAEECRGAITNRTEAIKNFIIVKGKKEISKYKDTYQNYQIAQNKMWEVCNKAIGEKDFTCNGYNTKSRL